MNTLGTTRELLEAVAAAVAGLEGAPTLVADLDPTRLGDALAGGAAVLTAAPPRITAQTFTAHTWEHDLTIAAGPLDDLIEAWRTLDTILAAVLIALDGDVDTITPARLDVSVGPAWPAFTLTLTRHIDNL